MIGYFKARDIGEKAFDIINKLNLNYIKTERIVCIRSVGSESRNTVARCHALSKIMQKGLHCEPFYVLEVLSERFDKLNEEEKIKIIIHELLHIPKTFGGGFRHHNVVNNKAVKRFYAEYKKASVYA